MKWIFWDFDGTLAYREGNFSGAIKAVLDRHYQDNNIHQKHISTFLQSGFPWHNPEVGHEHLNTAELWWQNMEKTFSKVFVNLGVEKEKASEIAGEVRKEYVEPRSFRLFSDTLDMLLHFQALGWKQAIFSNHIPELRDIVTYHGLDEVIRVIASSADLGFEKPNPIFFKKALAMVGKCKECWMIGDNFEADVEGAELVDIKAALVRSPRHPEARHYARDLYGLTDIVV